MSGTEETPTPPCLCPPAHPRRSGGTPPHFGLREQDWDRPSMWRAALGVYLMPDGKGQAPCCSEPLVADSPACACLGVQIQLMATLACYSSSHEMFLLVVTPSCYSCSFR